MATNKAASASQSDGRKRALIELVTENRFHIIRACELASAPTSVPGVHRFIVRDPFGREHEVVVEFAPAARAQIARSSRRRLAPDCSYWLACAERALAAYLWTQDACPPDARLVLQEVCLHELELARCWQRQPMMCVADTTAWPEARRQTIGKGFYLQSIIAILILYLLATFAPRTLAPDLIYLRAPLSSSILYAAIFLSGTLCGLAFTDMTSINAARRQHGGGAAKVEDSLVPPSFDQRGLTPVERVIHGC
ncbi:MAG: hypothetical protein DMF64_19895 [Acidobacteria bacterium]|nr:MAG: hypothetical protein DMF64_19895 [Acidobacteriota bacterium]